MAEWLRSKTDSVSQIRAATAAAGNLDSPQIRFKVEGALLGGVGLGLSSLTAKIDFDSAGGPDSDSSSEEILIFTPEIATCQVSEVRDQVSLSC